MKPEFTRPFNAEHAQAGAPYCCRDGSEATVLTWARRSKTHALAGMIGINDAVAICTESGMILSCSDIRDLVMIPLGMCEGKPVFVGDILEMPFSEIFCVSVANKNFDICTWPKLKIEYPTTKLTDGGLRDIYKKHYSVEDRLRAVADAAIKHAIDSGQVVIEKIKGSQS